MNIRSTTKGERSAPPIIIMETGRFDHAALIVIDVQKAIDAPYHAAEGARNNPEAEARIAGLLALWREGRRPIFHVRHDSTSEASAYRPGQIGNAFKDEV